MSINGCLTQISAYLLEKVIQTPSSLDLFWSVAPVDEEEEPKIDNLQGLSSTQLAILHEIVPDLQPIIGHWTGKDITRIEYWKSDYLTDYRHFLADIYRLVAEGKTTSSFELYREWHLLSYIFSNDVTMDIRSFLVAEAGDDLKVNAILCVREIDDVTRYLEPEEVNIVAESLSKISDASILHRIQHGKALRSQLYSFCSEEGYEELQEFCRSFTEFYADAASKGNAMLIQIV